MDGALRGYIAGLVFVSTVVTVVLTVGSGLHARPTPSTDDEATQPSHQPSHHNGPTLARRMRRAPV